MAMKNFVTKLKSRYPRLDLPAEESDFLLIGLRDSMLKWTLGVAGVTIALAVSFSSNAYTSFIQVSDKCQARLIASDAILTGRVFAWFALTAAAAALLGLALPHLSKQFWHNSLLREFRQSGAPPQVLDGWYPTIFVAAMQFALAVLGLGIVVATLLAALSVFAHQTPEGLILYVRNIESTCVKQTGGNTRALDSGQ